MRGLIEFTRREHDAPFEETFGSDECTHDVESDVPFVYEDTNLEMIAMTLFVVIPLFATSLQCF